MTSKVNRLIAIIRGAFSNASMDSMTLCSTSIVCVN